MQNSTDRLIGELGLNTHSAETLRLWNELYQTYARVNPRDELVAVDAAARFLGTVLKSVSENLEQRGLGGLGAELRARALDTTMRIALDEGDLDD